MASIRPEVLLIAQAIEGLIKEAACLGGPLSIEEASSLSASVGRLEEFIRLDASLEDVD